MSLLGARAAVANYGFSLVFLFLSPFLLVALLRVFELRRKKGERVFVRTATMEERLLEIRWDAGPAGGLSQAQEERPILRTYPSGRDYYNAASFTQMKIASWIPHFARS